jgi:hypothetical protein
LDVTRISKIVLGKQTAAFKELWATHADDNLCFSIFVTDKVRSSPFLLATRAQFVLTNNSARFSGSAL